MSDDADETESDWSGYESGPFCKHWGDPSDCEEVCARCGHPCCAHGAGECWRCDVCDEFVDKE